eukprot:10649740-Karenia_brevis.AAC.1
MAQFHDRLAYIGGSAKLWGCDEAFDSFAEQTCKSISEIGAMVHTGTELWDQLEMSDKWHAKNTNNNKAIFANMIA